jgi:hypothetical protein
LTRRLPDAAMLPGGRATGGPGAGGTDPGGTDPGGPGTLTGRDASVIDLGPATDAVTELLAADSAAGDGPVADGLLPTAYAARRWRPALAALGVRRLGTADVVELLAGAARPPSWWARLYPLLMAAPDRDALGAVPLPLAVPIIDDGAPASDGDDGDGDGLGVRMVTGPRGVLLPADGLDVAALAGSGLPLRVVHPDAVAGGAARDALRTLGAVEGTPLGVLRDPAVREAVAESDPDDYPEELTALANAVLALVRDADLGPDTAAGGFAWLADLLLPDTGGEFVPAGELLFAGGPLDEVVASDAPFGTLGAAVADAWPARVLEAVGVMRTFGVLRADALPLDPDEPVLLDLDDSDTWVEDVLASRPAGPTGVAGPTGPTGTPGPMAPPVVAPFAAVRDLELVAADAWPAALAELARPPLRDVVCGPEPSYTRWWLSRHALLPVAATAFDAEAADRGEPEPPVLLPPPELALPGADPLLAGLFSPAAPLPGVDEEFLRRLGARLTLDDVLGDLDGVLDLLDRLGDVDRDVSWPAARALYVAAVAAVAAAGRLDPDGAVIDPPLTVRGPGGVVDAADAVVIDAPDLLDLVGAGRAGLRVPLDRAAEVSQMLGVPLASTVGDCDVIDPGVVPAREFRAPDGTPYRLHERLLVTDLDGRPTRVRWRVVGGIGGEIHADAASGSDALARALAWRSGEWHRRHAIAAALRDPAGTAVRDAEDDLDDL